MKLALLLFLPFLVAAQDEARPPVAVSYTLDVTDPKSGVARVEMVVTHNADDEVTLGIPTWAPGSYRTVAYHQGVLDLEAEIDGKKVEVAPTDHQSLWTLRTGRAPTFKVRYTLKPGAVDPLKGYLTEEHYDIQGPSAWLFILNRMNGPHQVTFKLPPRWRVATGLRKIGESTWGERDYDTFIDCPIELGMFSLHTFEHEGVTYEIVIHAGEPIGVGKLIDACHRIVVEQTRMFGGAPFERYVFLFHFPASRIGSGLEHLNSTHIRYSMAGMKEDPYNVASLTSHEFFHLWNVKRIRPRELGPFDYTRPVRSKALWLCEGVTSYYGDLTLVRAGLWTRDVYFNHLAGEVTILQSNPVRKTQSVEQAGWTVWDRRWGDPRGAIDYYNKGELLGWLLDLKIRAATDGRKSFDDVMRHLYRTWVTGPAKEGKGPIGLGFDEGAILESVNAVSGVEFRDFFTRYVSGTEELPYRETLAEFGLTLAGRKMLGLSLRDLKVTLNPPASSDAGIAGIKRGDKILKINGAAIDTHEELSRVVESLSLGEPVKLTIEREGEEAPLEMKIPLVEGSFALSVSKDATDAQRARVKAWLSPSK
jgi:predicted metalloprotease with PDZ domain